MSVQWGTDERDNDRRRVEVTFDIPATEDDPQAGARAVGYIVLAAIGTFLLIVSGLLATGLQP